MTLYQIICDGPGPHVPADGVLGTTDVPPRPGMRCAAPGCVPPATVEEANEATLTARAAAALTSNATYLALSAPTAAQNTAQIKALTAQVQAVIRLYLGRDPHHRRVPNPEGAQP